MNFKGSKKIAEDPKTATFEHPQGHSFQIVKHVLSQKMKKQIEDMPLYKADGGDQNYSSMDDQPEGQDQNASVDPSVSQASPPQQPQQQQPQQPTVVINNTPPPQQPAPSNPIMNGLIGGGGHLDTPDSPMPMPQAPAKPPVQKPASANAPQNAPQQAPQDLFGTQAYYDAYQKGLEEQQKGIQQKAGAESLMGQQQANALDQNVQQQQQVMQTYNDHFADLQKERQAFTQDYVNGHLDPQHYLNSLGTAGKISTAIGLILGGMGGGLMHQENPALKFLNEQINRDVDAQKTELGKKANLLSANMDSFKNLRDATDMTRVMQMDIVQNKLKEAAAKAMSPQAKANALQAAGALDMQAAPILSQMAARRALLGGGGGPQAQTQAQGQRPQVDPSSMIKVFAPEGEQSGLQKELQNAENMGRERDNLVDAFNTVDENNTVVNRIFHLGFTPAKTKAAMEPLLAQLVKDSEGRITPTDVEMMRPLFPAPGDVPSTVADKKAQMMKFINEKMNYPQLKPYQIDPSAQFGRYDQMGKPRYNIQAPNVKGSK